jgi:hypothetical protein
MKTIKNICLWSAALLLGVLLHACSEDAGEPITLEISAEEIRLDVQGLNESEEPAILTVTSGFAWKANKASWLELSSETGVIGATEIVVSAGLTAENREGYITITAGDQRRVIKVTQSPQEAITTVLQATPSEITVDYAGLVAGVAPAVTVSSNKPWTIGNLPEWITASVTTGAAGTNVPVSLAVQLHNSTAADRSGTFTVNSGIVSKSVSVTQSKKVFTASAGSLSADKDGAIADGNPFTVTSTAAWTATAEDWIHILPLTGAAGTATAVTVTVDLNDGVERNGEITFTDADGLQLKVPVAQEIGMIPDDGKAVGFVYFEDDFAWATGGADDIATNTVGTAPNMYTTAGLLDLFNEHGYTDPCYIAGNNDTRVIYFMAGYLKFSKTAFHGGLTHAIPNIQPNTNTNVTLSVDKVTYKSNPTASNTGNYDPNDKAGITTFALIVELDGPGSVGVNDGTTKSSVLADMYKPYGTPWAWETASIVLYGVTADTKVTIKTDQVNTAAMLCRYYLDNLKFEKHSVVTP